MRGQVGVGILAAGLLAAGGIALMRGGEPPDRRPPRHTAAKMGTGAASAIPPVVAEAPQPAPESPLGFALRPVELDNLPPDVVRGTATVEGPAGESAPPEELALTASQSEILRALIALRDGVLQDLRGKIAAATPDASESAAYASRAEQAHAAFVEAARGALLPDQRDRFDALLRTGRWGGYTLVIPTRR